MTESLTARRTSWWSELVAISRAATWWEHKVPTFLGVACLVASAGGMSFPELWPHLLVILAGVVPVAAYVSILNDVTDEADDERAGKPNRMAERSPRFKITALAGCAVLGMGAGFLLAPSPLALGIYAANWLVYTGYSAQPLRWKRRGLPGVLADAAGGQVFPTFWTAFYIHEFVAVPMSPLVWVALGIWSISLGVRGILTHQLLDYKADRQAKVRTLAVRMGVEGVRRLARSMFPMELIGLLVLLYLTAGWWGALLLAIYGAALWAMHIRLGFHVVLVHYREPARFLLFKYYVTFFPLTYILVLAQKSPLALILVPLHLLLFPDGFARVFTHLRHLKPKR